MLNKQPLKENIYAQDCKERAGTNTWRNIVVD